MSERPHIENISAWLNRRGPVVVPRDEIASLRGVWRDARHEGFADFTPIKLVTIMESFVQECIKEIIERGSPYLERAKRILQPLKFDYDYLTALHGRKFTVGDLAAHAVSVTNLDNILSSLTILIGPDFKERFLKVHDRWAVEINGEEALPIIVDFDRVATNVSRVFSVRHILVHELPRDRPYELEELEGFFDACACLCLAIEAVVRSELYGNYPLTQAAMTELSLSDCESAQAELESVLKALEQVYDLNRGLLDSSQNAWEKFAYAEARLQASVAEGGSVYSLVHREALEKLTRARTQQLRGWIDRAEGDI